MQSIYKKLTDLKPLTIKESTQLFHHMLTGKMDPVLISSVLTALKIRQEHKTNPSISHELLGATNAMIKTAKPFPKPNYPYADIVGTGGDGLNTINVSTLSACVCAAYGLKIAKHGNRAVSGMSGSSELVSHLGMNLLLSPNDSRALLDQYGLCFLFAPHYHTGMKYVMPVRKILKTRTLFNILGPLANPANPDLKLIGVYDPNLIKPVAKTLLALKIKHAFIVHGSKLDEVAIHGKTKIAEIINGKIEYYQLSPEDFGIQKYELDSIICSSPKENYQTALHLLKGTSSKAVNALIAVNSALVLRLFGNENIKENTEKILDLLASGTPYQFLQNMIKNES